MKDQIDTELDLHMGRLAELVGEMKMAIEAFGQRGFLKKMFRTTHVVRQLMYLHRAEEEGDTRGHRLHHPECPD
jgi:hypothetical protein